MFDNQYCSSFDILYLLVLLHRFFELLNKHRPRPDLSPPLSHPNKCLLIVPVHLPHQIVHHNDGPYRHSRKTIDEHIRFLPLRLNPFIGAVQYAPDIGGVVVVDVEDFGVDRRLVLGCFVVGVGWQ
jgi:hypothetical protein